MDKKQEDSFLEMILKGEAPSREKLKDMFPAAFMRMEDKYGKNYWTLENVTHYSVPFIIGNILGEFFILPVYLVRLSL